MAPTTDDSATADAARPPLSSTKSTSELASDLSRQITELIHSEIQLAKAEVSEKGRRLGIGAGGFGISGIFGLLALGCLVAAAIAALQLAVVLWVAALVVGGGCFLVAAFAAMVARGQVKRAAPPMPTEAIESTKEDVEWLKTQAKSASR